MASVGRRDGKRDSNDEHVDEMVGNSKKFPLFRFSLSAFIVFHLFCALTVPNRGSSPTNGVMKVVEAYTSLSGFWSSWGFFAPNPGPQMQIEYQLLDKEGKLVKSSVWPELVTGLSRPDRNIRRISSGQYMVLAHPEAAAAMLIPYLCRQNPGIGSVRLTSAVASFPKVNEILDGTRAFGDDVNTDRRSMGYDFCPKSDLSATPTTSTSSSSAPASHASSVSTSANNASSVSALTNNALTNNALTNNALTNNALTNNAPSGNASSDGVPVDQTFRDTDASSNRGA